MDILGSLPVPFAVLIGPLLWTWMRPAEQAILLVWMNRFWPIMRTILGGFFLLLGVLGIILPILQGVLFLIIGAALVGPRHRILRWSRVQYRLFLRKLDRSPNRFWAWVGSHGRQSLRSLRIKTRAIQQRISARFYRKRRFRIIIIPDQAIVDRLNQWRTYFDPAYRYGLPPHIVLVATSKSIHREVFEDHVRQICQSYPPFLVELQTPMVVAEESRIICPVNQGSNELKHLQQRLVEAIHDIDPTIRITQRIFWPGLTVAKIKRTSHLLDVGTQLSEQSFQAQWLVEAVYIYEERFGHQWHCVHSLFFR